MDSIRIKLKSQVINGENCLWIPIKGDFIFHQFHMGMIATQKQLEVVPVYCGYSGGEECLIFNISGLIPIKQYVEKSQRFSAEGFLSLLGNTILTLMEYLLNPSNIVYEMDYIYWDPQTEKLRLLYLPLESPCNETTKGFEETIVEVIQGFPSSKESTLLEPMHQNSLVNLLIDLRESNLSVRQLALRLSMLSQNTLKRRAQESVEESKATVNGQGTLREMKAKADVKPSLRDNVDQSHKGKKVKVKSIKPSLKMSFSHELRRRQTSKINILRFIPILIGLVGSLCVFFFTDFSLNTKMGMGLIAISVGCYLSLKMKDLTVLKSVDSPQSKPIEKTFEIDQDVHENNPEKNIPFGYLDHLRGEKEERQKSISPIHLTDGTYMNKVKDETVRIDHSANTFFLMIRTDHEPQFIPIQSDLVSIGRNPAVCDILLDEAGVGRLHAELHKNGEVVYIKDLHSVNGTYLNGKRVISNQYCELKKGDQIKIGTKELVLT